MVRVPGQGLREPAQAAAEVERAPALRRQTECSRSLHQGVDLGDAGGEELVRRPPAALACRVGEDGPHGVVAPEGVPMPLQIREVHEARHIVDRTGARRNHNSRGTESSPASISGPAGLSRTVYFIAVALAQSLCRLEDWGGGPGPDNGRTVTPELCYCWPIVLTPGTRLGVYKIISPIGEGGMGQVYRARDTRLDRDVAIKVLPEAFAHDAERLARFTREAKTLASLNHPNIAALHGLEESPSTGSGQAGVTALVMELVEGEDLSQRIARGAIPLDEALPIAKQIAEALEAAHEQGIVHRDLKPANIKVRADGTVKVLDFGLAKALERGPGTGDQGPGDAAHLPTITSPAMTQAGMILGTAAYMSPEQARGKPVDKRADIWAFGVVLFEMLTGRRLFEGESISDTLAAVLKTEPEWTRLPDHTPAALRRLLRRCLERDPKRRLHDIADARIEFEESAAAPVPSEGASSPRVRFRGLRSAAALLVVAALAFGAARWTARGLAPGRLPQVAFAVQPTPGGRAIVNEIALSRDGHRLVFLSSDSPSLQFREMGGIENHAIPGTEGGQHPFIAPDGKWLGFFADGKLKKIAFEGGDAIPICDAALDGPGASWGLDGSIYFTQTFTSGLLKVDANGGSPVQVTTPDRARGEAGHLFPDPLPGGAALVFTVFGGSGMNGSSVALLDVRSGRYEVLFEGAAARYVASGHLVFYRRGAYYAVPFDPAAGKVTGPARAVLPDVRRPDPSGESMPLVFSDDGRLAYVPGTWPTLTRPSRLAWVSRAGVPTMLPFEGVHNTGRVSLSPDEQRVAVARYAQGESQIWIYDLVRGTEEQLTREGVNTDPAWHPSGTHVAFTSIVRGSYDILRAAADGSQRPEPLVTGDLDESRALWSLDGRSMILQVYSEATGPDLVLHRLDASPDAHRTLVATPLADTGAMPSRDGKWLAYSSGNALYVSPFPGMGSRTLIGPGARSPRWSVGTRELFFLQGDDVMVARYAERSGSIDVGPPQRLFEAPQIGPHVSTFDVSADGTRLLFLVPMAGQVPGDEIHVRLNGFDALRDESK